MGKPTEEIIEKMVYMYTIEEKSTVDIEKELGISRGSIRYQLNKRGVTCRPRKKVQEEILLNKVGTRDFDYFLGILASDGSICQNTISLEFAENNKEILEHWNSFLEGACNINIHTNKFGTIYYKISFMNKKVCELLSTYGITPNKSLTITMPYMNWDILRGIFDGDGSLVKDSRSNNWRFKISSGSVQLLKQIQLFLLENNINSSIRHSSGQCYDLDVSKFDKVYKIYCNMYKDSSYFLRRKYDKFGPLVEKFTKCRSVNSVNGMENQETEPSLIENEEGAETRNGEPNSDKSDMVNV